MKATILVVVASIVMLSCNPAPKTDPATARRAEAMALYEKNLEVLKLGLQAFENEQMDTWATGVSDSVVWNSPAYGSKPGGKQEWLMTLGSWVAEWDSIKLTNPIFLPGLDTETYEPDGSVRYYGTWVAKHKSGIKTSVNYYGSYEFNSANKIVEGSDFFDVGGMLNAVSAAQTAKKK